MPEITDLIEYPWVYGRTIKDDGSETPWMKLHEDHRPSHEPKLRQVNYIDDEGRIVRSGRIWCMWPKNHPPITKTAHIDEFPLAPGEPGLVTDQAQQTLGCGRGALASLLEGQ